MPRKSSNPHAAALADELRSGPKAGDDLDANAQQLRVARGGQERIDGVSQLKALDAYKEVAADYAKKAQVWKDSQEARDVRLGDLVKVHAHKPFDDKAAARVSKETARAVQAEKNAIDAKREAKAALDSAWATVASFEDQTPVRPLIPDDEDEEE